MDNEAVKLSTLLTLAVSILGLGVNLIQQGLLEVGGLCIIVGFGIMVVGFTLYEKGVIEKVMKLGGKKRRRPDAD